MVATRSSSKAPETAPPRPPPSTSTTAPTTTTRSRTTRTTTNNNNKSATPSTTSTSTSTTTNTPTGWTHTPTILTLAWLAISLPLVAWDTGYVLGRPATMPGGWAHWPLWSPYALYGEVDHVYGFKQWNAGNGFTAAQASLNVVETIMYLVYFTIWSRAAPAPANNNNNQVTAARPRRKSIAGRAAAWAVVFAFSAAVMTLSKTVLYWLNEAFSAFDNIGHNAPGDLLLLWIIPKYVLLVSFHPTAATNYGFSFFQWRMASRPILHDLPARLRDSRCHHHRFPSDRLRQKRIKGDKIKGK